MQNIIDIINTSQTIDINLTFDIIKECNSLLSDNNNINDVCNIAIHVLNRVKIVTKDALEVWSNFLESIGFYPYLEKYKNDLTINSLTSEIRKNFFKSSNLPGIYLHEEQRYLLDKIFRNINLIISAPTSFGKSLLIEEVVASQLFSNILIIQPTLALLDETRKKMVKYSSVYNLIVRTNQIEKEKNIFLLTAERTVERKRFNDIDLIIIDEFYKLSQSRDDERSSSLNVAFLTILKKFSPQFLLLGPNIDKISEGFTEKYNAEFYKTNYSLVYNNTIKYYLKETTSDTNEDKELKLFELLLSLKDEQSIIYCSSPNRAQDLAIKFKNFLKTNSTDYANIISLPILEWIEENFSSRWNLHSCIKHKIGIHDGSLPRHLTSSIIAEFNDSKINYLFCTTTIIEGVNTSAKNIIYFDNTKGNKIKLDYFDYSNIKGRAGRLMNHLIGNIYTFNNIPEKSETEVDIPFFQQNPITDEVLINIEDTDMKFPDSPQSLKIKSLEIELRELLKSNAINIEGQKNILKIMETSNLKGFQWTGFPSYDNLVQLLGTAWDNFGGSQNKLVTRKSLPTLVNKYRRI